MMPVSQTRCRFEPLVEEPDLEPVPALVVVLAHVHRHVEVFDQVHEEPQGVAPLLDGLRAVLEDHLQLADLGDEVTLRLVPAHLSSYRGSSSGTST